MTFLFLYEGSLLKISFKVVLLHPSFKLFTYILIKVFIDLFPLLCNFMTKKYKWYT